MLDKNLSSKSEGSQNRFHNKIGRKQYSLVSILFTSTTIRELFPKEAVVLHLGCQNRRFVTDFLHSPPEHYLETNSIPGKYCSII